MQPTTIQHDPDVHINETYGTIEVALVDDLKSGGIGPASTEVIGYVDVMSPEPIIYFNKDRYFKAPPRNSYMYRHELTHVLQKEMVAEKAGGYPSVWNPVKSYTYYYYLLKLNYDLAKVMPTDNHDAHEHSMVSGLEVSADCYAQKVEYIGKPMQYLGSVGCNAEQKYIAMALISGRWPTPLNDEEKAEAYKRFEAQNNRLTTSKEAGK